MRRCYGGLIFIIEIPNDGKNDFYFYTETGCSSWGDKSQTSWCYINNNKRIQNHTRNVTRLSVIVYGCPCISKSWYKCYVERIILGLSRHLSVDDCLMVVSSIVVYSRYGTIYSHLKKRFLAVTASLHIVSLPLLKLGGIIHFTFLFLDKLAIVSVRMFVMSGANILRY